ncbi:hydrolase Nlp/P60 [Clostridium sp. OM02-18AC]|uniref:C40 family peptidase n=1 Tax=Clostridium sp. OM02-18AC TaxID=2292311 RepID=UPI000E509F14|nr:C40 family peptidase [Clostridium sp. OM02-18AC]RHV68992.1 hydrolase Nlp/P60 [Clostridium sp. OM02-18AC]
MSEEKKDYTQILKRARRRRKRAKYLHYAGIGVILLLLALCVVMFAKKGSFPVLSGNSGKAEAGATASNAQEEISGAEEAEALSIDTEGQADQEDLAAKQAVVDSYQNLGLVQVSGYLNVRETPGSDGNIIGKLEQNSACEILGTEGDWDHITSGGIEGYIHNQYVISGDEARSQALSYVTKMAIIQADKLNIRQEPVLDPANVVGQALMNERYPVEDEQNGWVKIDEGYISTEFVTVEFALNEARKLDLKTMALNQYDNLVISKVNNYLNIRKEPSTDSSANIIGKFPSKAAGEILETVDGWYKIKSGSITGYITADPQYVAVGQEAKDLAVGAASLMAIVTTDRLNVRAEPNTDAKIWTQISKEERYNVVSQLDGWVEIELDTGDGDGGESADNAYISTRDNNVEVRYALNEAIKFSPLEEKANQSASLRSQVVNYALQFVGGRYVWGGNDPHTGADCSGFVRYVLSHVAGVGLPRTSREQAKAGRSIKSSEMRPGDLIFYTNSKGTVNHVAMYIGNGQIVHAASRRSGIKISTWNYRTPKTIRSFLD